MTDEAPGHPGPRLVPHSLSGTKSRSTLSSGPVVGGDVVFPLAREHFPLVLREDYSGMFYFMLHFKVRGCKLGLPFPCVHGMALCLLFCSPPGEPSAGPCTL